MSEEQAGATAGGKWSPVAYIKGRAGRKEYWAFFALLCVVGLLVGLVTGEGGSSLSVVFAFVQIRRLHDLGRSGWWLLPFFIAPLALPIAALEIGLQGDRYPFDPEQFAKAENWSNITLLVSIAGMLIAYVWMGVRRGDAGDNRFGPPPPNTLKQIFQIP